MSSNIRLDSKLLLANVCDFPQTCRQVWASTGSWLQLGPTQYATVIHFG